MKERVVGGKLSLQALCWWAKKIIIIISMTVSGINDRIRFYS